MNDTATCANGQEVCFYNKINTRQMIKQQKYPIDLH